MANSEMLHLGELLAGERQLLPQFAAQGQKQGVGCLGIAAAQRIEGPAGEDQATAINIGTDGGRARLAREEGDLAESHAGAKLGQPGLQHVAVAIL